MTVKISFELNSQTDARAVAEMIVATHRGLTALDKRAEPEQVTHFQPGTVEDEPAPATDTTLDPKIGVETDSRGVPWLADAHAGTKGKNKDGTWKKKRGVDDAEVEKLEQAALAEIADTPDPAVPDEAQHAAPEPAPTSLGLPGEPVETAPAPVTWEDLVNAYTAAQSAGRVTEADMVNFYAAAGTDINDLQTNETARRAVLGMIENAGTDGLPG